MRISGARAAALAAGLIVLSGCETLGALTEGVEKPTASVTDVRLTDLTLEAVAVDFDVEIRNPYGVPLPLADVAYSLASGPDAFATGRTTLQGAIAANGSKVVTLPARVRFRKLLDVLADVRPGALVPYTAALDLSVEAPGGSRLTLPLRHEAELPVPAAPRVKVTSLEWTRLALDEAAARLQLRVVNTNDFPLELTELHYGLSLAERSVARTTLGRSASFAPGGETVLDLPLSFAPVDLGLGFFRVLGGDGASYDISGTMGFDSAFGPLSLPFERTGDVPFTR